MDKKQIKCKACGTVLSNIYGSVEDPQLAPENGNSKELYPNNKNDMACYFCGPACVSKFTSMTKWNGDKGIDGLNDYTDGNESKASEIVKDKYGKDVLELNVAAYISPEERKKSSTVYLDNSRKSFPVRAGSQGCIDLHAAVSAWGRYRGKMTFEEFKSKVKRMMEERGCSLPKSWSDSKD